ncbi:MAG: hypothetical protein HC842_02825 [Cytophagales bacterium]|nr:hypothetical protein [Cytophagales bacterium]
MSVTPALAQPHLFPRSVPRSQDFTVYVNGQEAMAYRTSAGTFVSFHSGAAAELEVRSQRLLSSPEFYPRRLGIKPQVEERRLRFTLAAGQNALLEMDGFEQLFFYACLPPVRAPEPDAPGLHYFPAGRCMKWASCVWPAAKRCT